MDISYHAAPYEDVLDRAQVWVFNLLDDGDALQLDVQKLVDALECAADRDIILKLDGDFVVDKSLEEAEE